MLGFQEILILGAVVVIFFTWRRLPDAVRALKKSAKELKAGMKDDERAVRDVSPKPVGKGEKKDS